MCSILLASSPIEGRGSDRLCGRLQRHACGPRRSCRCRRDARYGRSQRKRNGCRRCARRPCVPPRTPFFDPRRSCRYRHGGRSRMRKTVFSLPSTILHYCEATLLLRSDSRLASSGHFIEIRTRQTADISALLHRERKKRATTAIVENLRSRGEKPLQLGRSFDFGRRNAMAPGVRSRLAQMLFPSPILATSPPPFAADDGRRQRCTRGPLMTLCLCPAAHDAACSSVVNPLTIVGFMPGIVTSTAYSIARRERIRYVASACGCLSFPMPVIIHQLPLERSCSTAVPDGPSRCAESASRRPWAPNSFVPHAIA
jgi:hypothetical protein